MSKITWNLKTSMAATDSTVSYVDFLFEKYYVSYQMQLIPL